MRKALNDNSELTFTRIGLAAARVVDGLDTHKERNEHGAHDCERSHRDKEKSEDHSRYIDDRLREWRAWERRISGKG